MSRIFSRPAAALYVSVSDITLYCIETTGRIELVLAWMLCSCTYSTLCYEQIRTYPIIKVLSSGNSSQTAESENFTAAVSIVLSTKLDLCCLNLRRSTRRDSSVERRRCYKLVLHTSCYISCDKLHNISNSSASICCGLVKLLCLQIHNKSTTSCTTNRTNPRAVQTPLVRLVGGGDLLYNSPTLQQ